MSLSERLNKKRYMLFALLVLGVLLAAVVTIKFYGTIKGAYNRWLYTPDLVKNGNFIFLEEVENPSRVKIDFYKAYEQKKGYFCIKQKRVTIEGTIVYLYLATDNGNLHLVIDYTYDSYSNRSFKEEEPKDVLIGMYSAQEGFIPSSTEVIDNNDIRIKVIRKFDGEILI